MANREKLVEMFDEAVKICGETRCDRCDYFASMKCVDERVADYLIANGVTIQEWIPVTERLPEEDGFVIVWHDETEIALFSEGKFCFYDAVGCLREYVEVTHWMPLPTPPKGE